VDAAAISTKFGNARLNKRGYYIISSKKECNNRKKLHRLIYEDYYKVSLLDYVDVHHIDGDKTNNDINNLELLTHEEHSRQHMLGDRNPMKSKEARLKLSQSRKGKDYLSAEQRYNKTKVQAERHNVLGLFRVSKVVCTQCNSNYRYYYNYQNNGKKIGFTSINLLKLKNKVIENGFEWCVVNEDRARVTAESEGLTLEDLL
jgi:hypothetical protein